MQIYWKLTRKQNISHFYEGLFKRLIHFYEGLFWLSIHFYEGLSATSFLRVHISMVESITEDYVESNCSMTWKYRFNFVKLSKSDDWNWLLFIGRSIRCSAIISPRTSRENDKGLYATMTRWRIDPSNCFVSYPRYSLCRWINYLVYSLPSIFNIRVSSWVDRGSYTTTSTCLLLLSMQSKR